MRSVVVLPHPEGPNMLKNSPSAISSDRSSTAATSPNILETRSRRTSISVTERPPSPSPAGGMFPQGGGDYHLFGSGLNSLQPGGTCRGLYGEARSDGSGRPPTLQGSSGSLP